MFGRVSSEGFLGEVLCNQFHVRKMRSHHQVKSVKNKDKDLRVLGILSNIYESPEIRACRGKGRLS